MHEDRRVRNSFVDGRLIRLNHFKTPSSCRAQSSRDQREEGTLDSMKKLPEEERRRRKKESERKWAEKNPDYKKKYARSRLERGIKRVRSPEEKQRLSISNRARYERKKEQIKAAERERRKKNPAKTKADKAAYYIRNRDKIAVKASENYRSNRDHFLKQAAKYRAENKPKTNIRSRVRRARVANAVIGNKKALLAWQRSWRNKRRVTCYWCQQPFRGKDCHADHIIPLGSKTEKPGSHSVENMCISCPSCNHRKSAKTLAVWNTELTQPVLL